MFHENSYYVFRNEFSLISIWQFKKNKLSTIVRVHENIEERELQENLYVVSFSILENCYHKQLIKHGKGFNISLSKGATTKVFFN